MRPFLIGSELLFALGMCSSSMPPAIGSKGKFAEEFQLLHEFGLEIE